MPTDTTELAGTGSGKLYVFIHGLISLIERPRDLLALVVDMGDAHTYRAGDWLSELPLARGTIARLSGVNDGGGGLSDAESVLTGVTLLPSPHIYATIVLPRPIRVLALRRREIPASALQGTSTGTLVPSGSGSQVIAGLRVLEYEFPEASLVRLDGHAWGPATPFGDNPRIATLHLIAQPELLNDPLHPREEFNRSMLLFANVDLSLLETLSLNQLEPADYPAGLSTAEALTLAERRSILESVAAFYKNGQTGQLAGAGFGGPGGELCGTVAARTGP